MDGTEQTKTFRLTGLLENYSVYWDELGRDVHQELPDEFFLPVSGLVTEETAQSMTGSSAQSGWQALNWRISTQSAPIWSGWEQGTRRTQWFKKS